MNKIKEKYESIADRSIEFSKWAWALLGVSFIFAILSPAMPGACIISFTGIAVFSVTNLLFLLSFVLSLIALFGCLFTKKKGVVLQNAIRGFLISSSYFIFVIILVILKAVSSK